MLKIIKYQNIILITSVFFTFFNKSIFAQGSEEVDVDTFKIKYKRYIIRKYQENDKYIALVTLEGKEVYRLETEKSSYIHFVAIRNKYTNDITGDGTHNFIFQEYLGDKRETTVWHILSLGRFDFKLIGKITSEFTTPWMGDFVGKGIYDATVMDYTFAKWNTDFLQSPFVEVVLSYQDGKYQISRERMFKQVDSLNEQLILEIRQGMQDFYEESKNTYPFETNVLEDIPTRRWGFISPKLWGTMFELIYSGNSDKAWEFLDACWYEEIEGKDKFLEDFKNQLNKSLFWEELKILNNWE